MTSYIWQWQYMYNYRKVYVTDKYLVIGVSSTLDCYEITFSRMWLFLRRFGMLAINTSGGRSWCKLLVYWSLRESTWEEQQNWNPRQVRGEGGYFHYLISTTRWKRFSFGHIGFKGYPLILTRLCGHNLLFPSLLLIY